MGSDIADRLHEIKSALPQGVELIAVSKFHPAEAISEAYAVSSARAALRSCRKKPHVCRTT